MLLVACSGHRSGHFDDVPDHAPKLVVLVVVDQWPEWSFEQKRTAFHAGFARMLTDGEWHVGHHPSAATLTAPGHALLGTGEPTSRSGILANQWWHRDLGVKLHAVEAPDGSTTADWLRVNGIADSIAAAKTGAKAVSISLKDRASILSLGHAGLPIWWDLKTQKWTTLATAPAWLDTYNATNPVMPRAKQVWTPLDPGKLAQLSGTVDDQPGETGGEKGFGPTFPHDPTKVNKPDEAFFAMPLGNEVVFEAARAAIAGEQLGADRTPDLLIISLSAHDYVGHAWGHESWEQWDAELRLDELLGHFMDDLDKQLGTRWSMIVTSDHGASPMPERVGGGRITYQQIQRAANHAAAAVLGPGTWIDNAHYPSIYFSKAMLAQPKGELASAAQRVMFALRAFPGIERVGRVSDYASNCDKRTGVALTLCLTFDPDRSGDLFYMPATGWVLHDADEPTATAHGSWHDYDQRVPLILIRPDRGAKHAAEVVPGSDIEMVRVATLLSRWLGVKAPDSLPRRPDPVPVPQPGSDQPAPSSASGQAPAASAGAPGGSASPSR